MGSIPNIDWEPEFNFLTFELKLLFRVDAYRHISHLAMIRDFTPHIDVDFVDFEFWSLLVELSEACGTLCMNHINNTQKNIYWLMGVLTRYFDVFKEIGSWLICLNLLIIGNKIWWPLLIAQLVVILYYYI